MFLFIVVHLKYVLKGVYKMAKSIVSSRKLLCHLTEQQYNKVLEDLTLPNPQYEAALKFSGYSRVNLPKYLYFYEETSKGIYVPRGYDPGFKTISIDKKADHLVSFPRFLLRLRDTQHEAVDAFLASPEEDGFIIIPTGAGKSIVRIPESAVLKSFYQRYFAHYGCLAGIAHNR